MLFQASGTSSSDDATARSLDNLKESITNLREEFLDKYVDLELIKISLI